MAQVKARIWLMCSKFARQRLDLPRYHQRAARRAGAHSEPQPAGCAGAPLHNRQPPCSLSLPLSLTHTHSHTHTHTLPPSLPPSLMSSSLSRRWRARPGTTCWSRARALSLSHTHTHSLTHSLTPDSLSLSQVAREALDHLLVPHRLAPMPAAVKSRYEVCYQFKNNYLAETWARI